MKRLLLIVAVVLFILSFWMPAYSGDGSPVTGAGCLRFCASAFSNPNIRALSAKLYYSGFVLTNLLFVILAAVALVTRKQGWIFRSLSVLLIAHVVSWLILNLGERMEHSPFPIYSGYFVWASAFLLLGIMTFVAGKNPYDKSA